MSRAGDLRNITATGTSSEDNYVLTYDDSTKKISLEAASGGGGTGDISFSASDLSTNANTMNLYVDADNNSSTYDGYYLHGGTGHGNHRFWIASHTIETGYKFTAGSSYYSAILQRNDQLWLSLIHICRCRRRG